MEIGISLGILLPGRSSSRPNLALHRVGFAIVPRHRDDVCALTALFSPLPDPLLAERPSAVSSLWHFPSIKKKKPREDVSSPVSQFPLGTTHEDQRSTVFGLSSASQKRSSSYPNHLELPNDTMSLLLCQDIGY